MIASELLCSAVQVFADQVQLSGGDNVSSCVTSGRHWVVVAPASAN